MSSLLDSIGGFCGDINKIEVKKSLKTFFIHAMEGYAVLVLGKSTTSLLGLLSGVSREIQNLIPLMEIPICSSTVICIV